MTKMGLYLKLILLIGLFTMHPPHSYTINAYNIQNGVIIYALPSNFDEYSYFTAESYASKQWNSAVYAGLIKRSASYNYSWIVDLATTPPQINQAQDTYTFTLRDDLRFSNGHKITSKDVEFSFKAILSLAINKNSYNNYIEFMDNNSITVIDSKKIEFIFKNKPSDPYSLLNFPIMDQEVFGDRYDRCLDGVTEDCKWDNQDGEDVVSAGPFMVQDVDNVHQIVTVVLNPFYYGVGHLTFDKLIFQKITDKETAKSALIHNLVDILDIHYNLNSDDLTNDTEISYETLGKEFSNTDYDLYWGFGNYIEGIDVFMLNTYQQEWDQIRYSQYTSRTSTSDPSINNNTHIGDIIFWVFVIVLAVVYLGHSSKISKI